MRHSRIAGLARDARPVIFCGVHGQRQGKIFRSMQYRLGTLPPPCRPPLSRRMSPAWRYHSTSKRAFIGLLVTYICSSIGLFTAVREFPFRRYLSPKCFTSAHRHCNRLLWSKLAMWATIPQCGNAPQLRSTGQTGFVVLPRLRSTARWDSDRRWDARGRRGQP